MDGKSLDIAKDKLEQLKQILPEAFTEEKVDWEKLRLTLGEDINVQDERYVLNWAGKSDAFRALQTPTTATLAPARDESADFDSTENIFIEGENLEVLKVLQKAYYGKIKMIYIDPPYNTGNDSFVYPDKFSESREDYLKRIQAKDEEGFLIQEGLFRKNSKDSGHYHSNWLSMMYPRLFLARNLLRDEGVIFVSIDDNEAHNLLLLMNEVFGEENFIAQVVWQKVYSPRMDTIGFSDDHDYIVVYQRSDKFSVGRLSFEQNIKQFNKTDQNSGKRYRSRSLRKEGKNSRRIDRPNLFYPLNAPDGSEVLPIRPGGSEGCWRWSLDKYEESVKEGIIEWIEAKNGWQVYVKQFYDENANKPPSTVWLHSEAGHNHEAVEELKALFKNGVFDNPKPTRLIKTMLKIGTISDKEDIVLDFFAGSASTAQAVMDLNQEDKGNRRFIMAQLPEQTTNPNYSTIAEISKERIRRAIKKTKVENPMFAESGQDLGFKVYKLKHSNFKLWRGDGIENAEKTRKAA